MEENKPKNKGGRPKGSTQKTLSGPAQDRLRPKMLQNIRKWVYSKDEAVRKWATLNFAPYVIKKQPVETNMNVTGFEDFLANAKKNTVISKVSEEQKN